MSEFRVQNSHSLLIGYILWIFGFMGIHRFYYGRPITGTIWLFTGGLLGIGWIVDAFLMKSFDESADRRFMIGRVEYSLAWLLLGFTGIFGLHRMYMGKWGTGILWLLTGGLIGVGVVYDFWTLNDQVDKMNRLQPSH